jgi:hypothetical protein
VYNDQCVTPVEQPGQEYERYSDRCIRPVWFGFALLEHGQLFAQEEILGSEYALWTQGKPAECSQVAEQRDYRFDASHDGRYLAISRRGCAI